MQELNCSQRTGLRLRLGAASRIAAALVVVALLGVSIDAALAAKETPRSERSLILRFLGGKKKAPLADVDVIITRGYGSSQKEFGPFRLDAAGTCLVSLAPGSYHLRLKSKQELPYLPVEELWNDQFRGPAPDLTLSVTNSGVEKWLKGKRRDEGFEPSVEPHDLPRITYTLLPACELVLRAVDIETGKGLPGAQFYAENAVGEDWAHPIDGENVGAKQSITTMPTAKMPPEKNPYLTDKDGNFRRLIGANSGFTYGVEKAPDGYKLVNPTREVTIDVKYGQPSAEYVFKFRRN